tara:strand:+ start:62219 stop:63730 length:1512 start_codon:yes stop_codon:yes gene_type:complete
MNTISKLLSYGKDYDPAIKAPDRNYLNYLELRTLVEKSILKLQEFGIRRNDRVAIIANNGPEMATAFITVSSMASAAPLNPAYRPEEFEYYLKDLNARAVIVDYGDNSPAIKIAKDLGIKVIYLISQPQNPAGSFELEGSSSDTYYNTNGLHEEDEALVLHTSGTTSKPKIVPLSQKNLAYSANNISSWLALSEKDICLNIMPLFHIHGLVAAVLSSLNAGASISCSPGFNALKFFSWLDSEKPTWYTGVPTMHQAILARAPRNNNIIKKNRLRFIRSSSAPLPSSVMIDLENKFDCPVIESYGMTEAAHQMASNPLPPNKRLPGHVGLAAGPEIAIIDNDGNILPSGKEGEVVIRGENVTSGYENNQEANTYAYVNGWFRTGDQGILDQSGYLKLTGRLKEIINRGGEKISPNEVDDVLSEHPSVHQSLVFAVPHDKLGEDVAAAVVLCDGETVSEKDLQNFLEKKLSNFKIPRQIVFLEEIPKGPTGKLQRSGLAKKLGLG